MTDRDKAWEDASISDLTKGERDFRAEFEEWKVKQEGQLPVMALISCMGLTYKHLDEIDRLKKEIETWKEVANAEREYKNEARARVKELEEQVNYLTSDLSKYHRKLEEMSK